MSVKLALLVTLVSLMSDLAHSKACKFNNAHKLSQVSCANFNTTPGWQTSEISIPQMTKLEKLVFKNVTGNLDLVNFTFESLHQLVISHSHLDNITMGHFPGLVFLTIVRNKKFPNLTRDIFIPTTHINWLSLVANNHTIMPSAFQILKNLTWLHIQNQNFDHLTGEFFKENLKLHELSIRNCNLERIDSDAFDKTVELEILSMNFNKIRYLEGGTFKNLKQLKILELHHNKFVDLSLEQFRGLVSVEVLGLPSSFLKNIDITDVLEVFPKLKKMEMKKRDFLRYRPLIEQLRKNEVDIIGTPHDCHNSSINCHVI